MRLKDMLQVRLAWKMRIDGFVLETDPLDGLGARLRTQGLTEPETREFFKELLRPGMVVLDIGAYLGQFSLVASRVMNGTGRILCLEPTPAVFEQLKRNIERNHCINVEPIHAAVSDHEGEATFYVHVGSNDQSSLHAAAVEEQVSYRVPLTTVDALVERAQLHALNLMKIDVEGHEISVLRGAENTIRRLRPAIVVEISRHQRTVGYSGADIKAFLGERNYNSFRLQANGRIPYQPTPDEINEQISHFNVLALPRQ
jgi:FkbM family methyltransferase